VRRFIGIELSPRRTYLVDRDQLATAILLTYDHRPLAVAHTLENDFGVEHYEAIRLTLAARICIDQGIEP
jgi:hypothetical protein